MSIFRTTLPALLFTTALAAPFSAYGFEAADLESRLKTQLSNQGMAINWASAEASGDGMVLKGVTIMPVGEKEPLAIGDATLTEITDEEDDIVRVGSITLPDYSLSKDGKGLAVTGFEITGLSLPGPATADELSKLGVVESFTVESVAIDDGGKRIATLNGAGFESEFADDGTMSVSGGIEAFSVDMASVEDAKSKEAMAAFGFEKLEGGLSMEGSWNSKDGNLKVDTYEISVDNAGSLGMTFDFGGYTLALVKQIQELNKQMANATEEQKAMQGMAMLGMMQQMVFNAASIRFDDDGITAKALDYAAKQQKMTPDDIKNQAKALLPIMMAQLENADLTAQVSAAVTKFLDDPQSLAVTAKPAAPQPFAQLMAAGMSSPKTLPALLGVTVTAND